MIKHYHFIGIGGIGMSALARILLRRGEKVTGSDLAASATVASLRAAGAEIFIGHARENVQHPDAVVVSTDIPEDNPEYLATQEAHIPILHRSELLAQLMEGYAPLLVTGTHGKTTTSSLLAYVLTQVGLDPTYAIGGIVLGLKTNGHHGEGAYFVAEADESDGSFLHYPCFGAIITNLENDHMNYWKSDEALDKGFKQFASQVASHEHLFWCRDDMRLTALQLDGYSYGFSDEADLKVDNFQQLGWKMVFDLTFQDNHYSEIEIPLIGAHNVLNAAAVFGMGLQLNIEEELLRSALSTFTGVGRRVEKKGNCGEIEVYDDYAHHPTEIFATLRALKTATHPRRLVVAFQPHRYTRTRDCLEEFSEAFEYADSVIITDIYAAREPPIPGITAQLIQKGVKKHRPQTEYVDRASLPKFLGGYLKPGDILITMGAGDITNVGPLVLEELKHK